MRSIKSRLTIYILLTAIVPVFAFLIYSLLFVSSEIKDTEIKAFQTKNEWSEQYLEQLSDQLADIVYSIHIEDGLLEQVDESGTSYLEIEEIVRSTLYNNSNVLSKVSIVSMNSLRGVSFDYNNGFTSELFLYEDLYTSLNNQAHGLKFIQDGNEILVIHTINDFDTQELKGIIILKLSSELRVELENIHTSQIEFILHSKNEVIINQSSIEYSDVKEDITFQGNVANINGFTVWTNKIGTHDLYISTVVTESEILAYSRNMVSVGMVIIFLSLLITIIVSLFISNNITAPIISLQKHMGKNELRKYKPKAHNFHELEVLEVTYNQMITDINKLINEKYKNEIERKSIQLKALQAQINPHFLSNTFQLIGGMALEEGNKDIYEATLKMSKLVRYAMRIDQKAVSLDEELTHILDYLDIQKLRFGDKLNYKVNIKDQISKIRIPKFTIQPIIENSFKYGLKKLEGIWIININSEVSEHVVITISDNGVGMNEEAKIELNRLFQQENNIFEENKTKDKKSIGLMNINSRIKLLYGKKYGIRIDMEYKQGVAIKIILPRKGLSV